MITDTIKETDKKCSACGGTMEFNPKTGKLICPYCGTEEAIANENPEFTAKEQDFSQVEDGGSCDWGTATKTVICKSCGAQTVYDVNEIANECPYCGSNQVMEAGDEAVMAPGGIVVFRLDAKDASERFKRWIGSRFFCPKLAKDSAKPKAFKGVYVPFWTFDSQTVSRYSGKYGKKHMVHGKDGKMVEETTWYPVKGQFSYFFDDVLVSASGKQNEAMLAKIEPFRTKEAVEYKPEYLAGFMAERYSVKAKEAWWTAQKKMDEELDRQIQDKIQRENHADCVGSLSVQTSHKNVTYKYLLLPVWISSFQYNQKVYHFMINGQTGKVSGKTPISWVKAAFVAAAVIAVIAVCMWLTRI